MQYFRCEWNAVPLRETGPAVGDVVLVLAQSGERAAALRDQIRAEGASGRLCWVQPGSSYGHLSGDNYALAPDCVADYETLLKDLEQRGAFPTAILILDWPEAPKVENHDWEGLDSEQTKSLNLRLHAYFALAGALARRVRERRVAVLDFEDAPVSLATLAREASAGFSRSLRRLHPGLSWRTARSEGSTGTAAEGRRVLCLPKWARWMPPLRSSTPQQAATNDSCCHWTQSGRDRACSAHRVSTGSRAAAVRWVVFWLGSWSRSTAQVVLSSRRPLRPETQQTLAAVGSAVEFRPMDVTVPAQVRAVYDAIRHKHDRLDGIIHAAGSITPALLGDKSLAEFDQTLAPKCGGTLVLDQVTREAPLDFFVLFSSLASVVGDFGQCDYAVANRFLDAFAAWRSAEKRAGRRQGRTIALDWPLWAEGGMHFDAGTERSYLASAGMESLTTEAGLEAFERCLSLEEDRVVIAVGDRQRLLDLFTGTPTTRAESPAPGFHQEVSSPVAGDDALEEELRRIIAQLLKLPEGQLGRGARFSSFGLDSLNMKELADRLSRHYQVRLSPTAFFEHDSIAALATFLIQEHGISRATPPLTLAGPKAVRHTAEPNVSAAVPVAAAREQASGGDAGLIAVIGVSGRFPQSPDLAEFWKNLDGAKDLVSETPPDRWQWRSLPGGNAQTEERSVARWGGFIADLDKFDAAFFGITPREAAFLDPRLRLLLETVWATFEDAGYRVSSLAGQPVGVFVGCQASEYLGLIGDAGDANPQAVLGNTHTMLANRVSFAFDLRGPSEAIDTACSSSLVAVHRAVRALQSGECRLAIVGGVSALLSPQPFVLGQQLGMLSPRGRCRTFDRSADGYVKGEGVGAVLLKPLTQALADGDHIHAMIRASGVNHGGKASFLTAPNPEAQAQLLSDTYRRAGINPATISYVEAHGTGTELGDPIEVDALRRAFRRCNQGTTRRPSSPFDVGWERSNRTSAIWNRRPASPPCSKWSWPCATGDCRPRSTYRKSILTCSWRAVPSTWSRILRTGCLRVMNTGAPFPFGRGSVRSGSAAPTLILSLRNRPHLLPGSPPRSESRWCHSRLRRQSGFGNLPNACTIT